MQIVSPFNHYSWLGVLQDLEEAIVLRQEALLLHLFGHLEHSMSLNSLASHLLIHYNHDGVLQDLEDVIVLGCEALFLHPQGYPHCLESLINLVDHLSAHHHHLLFKQGPSAAAVRVLQYDIAQLLTIVLIE